MSNTMTINPNDCKSGKPYQLAFRTGAHKDKKKTAKKYACRNKGKRHQE